MPDEIYNFDPLPAEEAIAIIQQRAPLRLDAFKRLLPELRAHAFTVSGIENFDALQGMRDLIATIPAGADYKKVRKQIAATLGAHIPLEDDLFEDAEAAAKHKAALMRRAEMIVRTQVTQAYSVVAYRELDEFRDVFPYWKYITVSDGRVRASHAALNNTILRNDHPFWKTHYPPWEFGCRCQVVGITEWEAGEERKRDARRPVEERQVMEGDLLKRLEDEGTLVRKLDGNPLAIDVRSPRDRGETDAWYFDPGDLAASFADLASRYDATVWRAFRAWAGGVKVDGNLTLADWLESSRPPYVKTPPAPKPVFAPSGTPVAGKLDTAAIRPAEQRRVAAVLGNIDTVHGDGPLPVIPVGHKAGRALGSFTSWKDGRARIDYKVRSKTRGELHPTMTLAHEFGHFIDRAGFARTPGKYYGTDDLGGHLADWWRAVRQSQAWGELQQIPGFKSRSYYTSPVEAWARSYAQFIAEESADPVMLAELATMRAGHVAARQWDSADFAPIRAEIRKLFINLNWITPRTP